MKRFPKDCNKECQYIRCFDLSVDDLVIECSLMNVSCDLCDEDYSYLKCPLENTTA